MDLTILSVPGLRSAFLGRSLGLHRAARMAGRVNEAAVFDDDLAAQRVRHRDVIVLGIGRIDSLAADLTFSLGAFEDGLLSRVVKRIFLSDASRSGNLSEWKSASARIRCWPSTILYRVDSWPPRPRERIRCRKIGGIGYCRKMESIRPCICGCVQEAPRCYSSLIFSEPSFQAGTRSSVENFCGVYSIFQ